MRCMIFFIESLFSFDEIFAKCVKFPQGYFKPAEIEKSNLFLYKCFLP